MTIITGNRQSSLLTHADSNLPVRFSLYLLGNQKIPRTPKKCNSAKNQPGARLLEHCYHSRLPNPLPNRKSQLHLTLATRNSPLDGN